MSEYRYRLQSKEPCATPNILGNHSMPVHTYRWKDIAVSNDLEELKKALPNDPNYRIVDTQEWLTMSRDKQIEEMSSVIVGMSFKELCIIGDGRAFTEIPIALSSENSKVICEALYNVGYRKSTEVAREIIEEAEKIFMFTCSSLEAYTDWQNFKKKYTEGEI